MTPVTLRDWESAIRERFAGEEVTALKIHVRFNIRVNAAQSIVWRLRDAGVLRRTEPGCYEVVGLEMTLP